MRPSRPVGWSPLRSAGTALPPNLLVVAKTVFVMIGLQGYVAGVPEPFLPFVRAIDGLPGAAHLPELLRAVILAAGVTLLLNRAVRAACLAIAFAYGIALLSSRGYYLNATVFLACLFFLMGLFEEPTGARFVRWQFVVLYLGSTVNKLFEPDWWSGQYFEHWMIRIVRSEGYAAVAAALPPMWLSFAMCWATIAIEATLAVLLAVPRLYGFGVALALVFHTLMVLLAGTTFGIFYGLLVLGFQAFFDWPAAVRMDYDPGRSTHRALRRVSIALDADGRYSWMRSKDAGAPLAATMEGASVRGLRAWVVAAVYTPAAWLALAVVLAGPALYRRFWLGA